MPGIFPLWVEFCRVLWYTAVETQQTGPESSEIVIHGNGCAGRGRERLEVRMEENIRSLIGKQIRYHRKARGYTLTEFSEMLHKSKSSISKYENGEVSIDIETLNGIARCLNIPLSRLVDVNERRDTRPAQAAPTTLSRTERLYVYIWDGRVKTHIRRMFFLLDAQTASLYVDIASYENYTQCKYYYAGEVQRFDASVRAFLVNPANERDLVLLSFADPLNYQSVFFGFFSSFSVGQFQPFSTKCIVSSVVIEEEEALKGMLLMSKEELRDFKKMNMFRVVSPNFLL